jgi:RNA polymerase sigma-70 factor (ECF subfamily)
MDVVQEVNVTLWRKQKQFRPGTNFKAWAFKTAHFHVLGTRRKLAVDGKRLIFDPELIEMLAREAPFDDEEMGGRLAALHLCLRELRDQDRELLQMRYARSVSIEEYARQHDRNAGTVRATLRRLRGILLECVSRKLKKETGDFEVSSLPQT